MAASRGLRGVRDDLWELGRHIVDIACFLSPILASAHADSPPPSPTADPQLRSQHQQPSLRLRRRHGPRRFRTPSPHPSAQVLAGILSDLAEISGGLRSGLSRLSAAFRDLPDSPRHDDDESRGLGEAPPVAAAASATAAAAAADAVADRTGNSDDAVATVDEVAAVGVSDDVLEFVGDLVKCPDSWLEFPVPVTDSDFHISDVQRMHIETMEHLSTDLAALRSSLCPTYMGEESFWRIYFALLHPRLNEYDSGLLSTQQILNSFREKLKGEQNRMPIRSPSLPSVISDNEIRSQQDESQAWENLISTRTRSQQSIDQFSEVPSIIDACSDDINTVTAEIGSTTGIGDGSVVMEKYMDALLTDLGETNSPSAQHLLSGNKNKASPSMSGEKMFYVGESGIQEKMFSNEASGDWHPVEDSDFEVVDAP